MKAGYKTSEFWLTLLTLVISVLVGMGVITDDEGEVLSDAVRIIFALVGGAAGVTYIATRAKLKWLRND